MENELPLQHTIENRILTIRGVQVMLDRDLAELYGVETRRLNEQVKRNIERFPKEFMFQITRDELNSVMSQIATSPESNIFAGQSGGTRKLPFAFTEHGVTMLSSVLKSETAIKASIQIVKAFVAMRHFIANNALVFSEINSIKRHQFETDQKIDELFDRMDRYKIDDTQGIFFQGQIFDSYAKFESFIQSAQKQIVLIDGYVDITVLQRLAKKRPNVEVILYTGQRTNLTALDIQQFNAQYPTLTMKFTDTMHDRFMIIDNQTLYHIGASLKDLGKKCFAFEILDSALIGSVLGNV